MLTLFGIGAIIGTGIFVLTGIAAATQAGPAVVVSFIFAGIACGFAALAYAELAACVGGCGSAYGYSYAAFGELIAWIIGWDLVLEYAVSSSAVAVGWSKYFNELLKLITGGNIQIPHMLNNAPLDYNPELGRIVATGDWLDLPAMIITGIITTVLVIGIKESARFNNIMVAVKLAGLVLLLATAVWTALKDAIAARVPRVYLRNGQEAFRTTLLG